MDFLHTPDDKLCELLFKGDSKAFEFIYNKYFKYLYRYVNHSLGSKEDSEEILHDLFLSIWQNRYGPTLAEKELLFPIPTAEIRNNSKLKQNKGY